MTTIQLTREQLRLAPSGFYSQVKAALETWLQIRAHTRIRSERKRMRRTLRWTFEELCDAKARALKSTGVAGTDHANLEAAILHLGRALDDYHDEL